MVRVPGLAVLVLLIGGAANWTRAVGQDPQPSKPSVTRIGFPEAMFKDVPPTLIQAAAKPFQAMIQKQAGLNGTLEICSDYKELADKLAKGQLEIGVFHGFEYAWVRDTPGLVPVVTAVPNCGKVQACLVVHVNSKVLEPRDLKGPCVLVPRGLKAHCTMFLERIQEKLPNGSCCTAKAEGLTPEEALDDVVAGKCEAVLVDISSLIAYKKNKGNVGRQLRVLIESELLPAAVVVYRKDSLREADVAMVRSGLIDCIKTREGRTFAMFWQLKGFEAISQKYSDHLDQCLKSYPPPTTPK